MSLVSIVIVNYNHPECITICTNSIANCTSKNDGLKYEVIVVDNGSNIDTVNQLRHLKDQGLIDKLLLEPVNHFFSEGNNIGVRNADPKADYVLLLNSDVGFVHPDWLQKMVAWMEGRAEHTPNIWGTMPTVVKPGPLDIVSFGWSYDENVQPSKARPEGFCCMFRKSKWQEMSPDFPYYWGFEEMVANVVRGGARCGVCWNYAKYLIHREQGSDANSVKHEIQNKRTPDMQTWYAGLEIETLDFTLGPFEHSSYLEW